MNEILTYPEQRLNDPLRVTLIERSSFWSTASDLITPWTSWRASAKPC